MIDNPIIGKALWFSVAALGMLLTALYLHSPKIDHQMNARNLQAISQLEKNNAVVDETTIKTRLGILQSYDALNQAMRQLSHAAQEFKNMLPPEISPATSDTWASFANLLERKRNALENFKSSYAVLKNSTNYLPFITREFTASNSMPGGVPELTEKVRTFLEKMLVLNLGQGVDSAESAQNLLRDIRSNIDTLSVNSKETLNNLVQHADIIFVYGQTVDTQMNETLSLPVDAKLKNIQENYLAAFTVLQKRASLYQVSVFSIAILLTAIIVLVLYRQQRLSHRLADSLAELNFHKFAVDEHAIVSIADNESNIVYVNDRFCEIGGYTREELIGRSHRTIEMGYNSEAFYTNIWNTVTNGEVWQGEIKKKKKDDSTYWVLSTIVPFLSAEGKPFQYISISTDITERKMMEEDLARARDDLVTVNAELEDRVLERTRRLADATQRAEVANRAKSEFLATMSHEIRTPMNGVIGMTGLLLDTELDSEQQYFTETIRSSSESLLTIINDVLDFSKLEAGKLELEHDRFALLDALEEVVDVLASKAHEAGLGIGHILPPELQIEVMGDVGRLKQVLMNLIGNAIKFTQNGGVIVTTEELGEEDDIIKLRFEVRDTGIGIDKDDCARLFESFTQVDASTTRKFGGTGLGLAISKRLIDAMGGEIGVDSELGVGSTFWFELALPLERRKMRFNPVPFADDLEQRRALVLDDNRVYRDVFKHTLGKWGIGVDTSHTFDQASDLARKAADDGHPYELFICDFQLPERGGLEFLQWIRGETPYEATPFILSSSSGLPVEIKQKAQALSAMPLLKPIQQSGFFDALITGWNLCRQDENQHSEPTSRSDEDRKPAEDICPLRILVADDNVVNQELVKALLGQFGHQVDVAANGREALEAIQITPYDLVFLEMQMPEMDGLEAAREIRALGSGRENIPIIAMAANGLKDDEDRCRQAGMKAYLSKPVNKDKLTAVINSVFPQDDAS